MSAALEASPGARLPRLLAGLDTRRSIPLREHLARHGRLELRRGELTAELDASGLSGRGGAGFPVARKLHAVAERRGRPVVVVNAAEGEPTSGKDKLLLRHLPHLVIDGAAALARELGARQAFIVHSETARHAGDALRAALDDRSRDACTIEAVALPSGFVRGQETAVVQYLNGGPALPRLQPPRPFQSGVGGRPTLVQNAETAAHIALIGRYGAAWFRELGTREGARIGALHALGRRQAPGRPRSSARDAAQVAPRRDRLDRQRVRRVPRRRLCRSLGRSRGRPPP